MRRRWPYVMLVLSLAANVGVLGFLAVRKYRDLRWEQAVTKKYMRRPDARRVLDRQGRRYFSIMDTLNRSYWATRHELGRLALETTADSARVESLLDVVERTELSYIRTRAEFVDSVDALLNDNQQRMWQRLAREAADSLARADSLVRAKAGRP